MTKDWSLTYCLLAGVYFDGTTLFFFFLKDRESIQLESLVTQQQVHCTDDSYFTIITKWNNIVRLKL